MAQCVACKSHNTKNALLKVFNMESLSVICLKTNCLSYSYICENESFLSVAKYRAEKRFDLKKYRITTGTDYDHTYNKELDLGYEIIGTIKDHCSLLEYCGQTGY